MARKKVKLAYMENNAARKATYRKRVKSIVKKTEELNVLCGVDACVVIYGPYDQAPVVWPPSEQEAKWILEGLSTKLEMDFGLYKFDQQAYLQQSITKAYEKLIRIQKKNRELEMEVIIGDLLRGKPIEQVTIGEIPDLIWVIDDKVRTLEYRITIVEGANNFPDLSTNADGNMGSESISWTDILMDPTTPWFMQAGPQYE